MTSVSPLSNVLVKGLYGDHEGKKEDDLIKIKEIKNLLIVQIVQYKNSSSQIKDIQIDGLNISSEALKVSCNENSRILWCGPKNWLLISSKKDLMEIEEIYAIGPAISILMDGYVQGDELISLRGTLVPATTINKFVGSIPILGDILVGKKTGEGVFGVSFKIKGPPNDLKKTVNPIKTLTPRFITRTLEKIKKTN